MPDHPSYYTGLSKYKIIVISDNSNPIFVQKKDKKPASSNIYLAQISHCCTFMSTKTYQLRLYKNPHIFIHKIILLEQ